MTAYAGEIFFFLHDLLLENRDLILELRKAVSEKLGSF